MSEIDRTKPVLVTGGSGYLASWIVKRLLEDKLHVHATVRDPADAAKVAHLTSLADASGGQLTLFKADLLDAGSFDEAMQDCELVIHTASPFMLTGIEDAAAQLIEPAKEGTRNVLNAVKRNGQVRRVVLTSSTAAIYGDNADIAAAPGGKFTEKQWNVTSSATHQPYAYSKTIAERAAWSVAEKQNHWDLVVINPGWMLGPSLSKRKDGASVGIMVQFGDGTYKSGVPALYSGIVDVRDAAAAHIKAGFNLRASGRHIVVNEVLTLFDIAAILRRHFGNAYPFPRRQAPKFVFWLIAPLLGYTRQFVSRNVGIPIAFDNAYSKRDLDMAYIPVEETVREHFQQIIDDGLLM